MTDDDAKRVETILASTAELAAKIVSFPERIRRATLLEAQKRVGE